MMPRPQQTKVEKKCPKCGRSFTPFIPDEKYCNCCTKAVRRAMKLGPKPEYN